MPDIPSLPAPRPLPRPDPRRGRRALARGLRAYRLRTVTVCTFAVGLLLGIPLLLVDDAVYQRDVQRAGPVVVAPVVEVEQTKGGPTAEVRVAGRRAEVYDLQGRDPRVGQRLRVVVDPDDRRTVVLADGVYDPHRALVDGVVAGTAAAVLLLGVGLTAGRPPRAAVRALRRALHDGDVGVRRGTVVRAEPSSRGRAYGLVHGAQGEHLLAVDVALEDGGTASGWWRAPYGEVRPGRPVLLVGDLASGWSLLSTTTTGSCWPHAPAS